MDWFFFRKTTQTNSLQRKILGKNMEEAQGPFESLEGFREFCKKESRELRTTTVAASQWNSELFVQGILPRRWDQCRDQDFYWKAWYSATWKAIWKGRGGEGKCGYLFAILFFFLFAIFLFDSKVVCWWLKMVCSLQICRWATKVPWNALRLASAPEKETKKAKWETKRVLERCSRLH